MFYQFAPKKSALLIGLTGSIVCAFTASAAENPALDYDIVRTVARKGYDGKTCWVHARAGAIPSSGGSPVVVMTTQKLLLTGSDVFYALHQLRTEDLGRTWSDPARLANFARRDFGQEREITVCDFTPKWHRATGRLLGIGHTVVYKDNRVMHVRPRATAYAVYDTSSQSWSDWKTLEMPSRPEFENAGAGCTQRVDLPNGEILLPIYFKSPSEKQYSATIVRCRFDGERLEYVEHGNEMTVDVQRGFAEPSLARFQEGFYLTLRNDEHGYVCSSTDGLHYNEPRKWTFDDGKELGNYNTQQHWVTHSDGLFLVYTRRGLDNDHVFRHRAPLLIARVDPARRVVLRDTQRVLVPERGARLGNFGVTDVSGSETWVTVTEWMQRKGPDHVIPVDNERGADNSIYVVKLKWNRPNRLVPQG